MDCKVSTATTAKAESGNHVNLIGMRSRAPRVTR